MLTFATQSKRLGGSLALALLCIGALAADWAQFRGPDRSGISPETGLMDAWPEGGPKRLWKRDLGSGFSCITVSDGRLYTLFSEKKGDGGTEFAGAFDPDTGKLIWQVELGKILVDEYGNGPRSTPAVSGDTVYVLGSYGRLMALATADGKVKWEKDLNKDFESKTPRWGYSGSPLVHGDALFVETGGGEGKAFTALDKATGKTRWTVLDGNGQTGYSSPLLITLHGKEQVLFLDCTGSLVSFGLDGKQLWSYKFSKEGGVIPMPVPVPPNGVFLSAAGDDGAVLIRITKDNKVTEAWKNPRMRNNWSSSLLLDGYIYGFDNAALKCLSAESGKQVWRQRGFGKGSLVTADGKLYVLGDDGALAMARATPEGYKELGRVQAIEGKSWTAPSIAGGRIYVRNLAQMACYRIAQ